MNIFSIASIEYTNQDSEDEDDHYVVIVGNDGTEMLFKKDEFVNLTDRRSIHVGLQLTSDFAVFEDAFNQYVWNCNDSASADIVNDYIVSALTARVNPKTKDLNSNSIGNWRLNETRICKDRSGKMNITRFCEDVNKLLPDNIRIAQVQVQGDARIHTLAKSDTAAYFILTHPAGDCYGILDHGRDIYQLYEF